MPPKYTGLTGLILAIFLYPLGLMSKWRGYRVNKHPKNSGEPK